MKIGRAAAFAVAGAIVCATAHGEEKRSPATSEPNPRTERTAGRMQENEPAGMTFYCCDSAGKFRCNVNAPGPPGTSCFCPGVVPAGILCVPPEAVKQ